MDDVINISGHRLGTAEIEDALVSTGRVSLRLGAVIAVVSGIPPPTYFAFIFCSVQASHPAVPETAVIGCPHDIKGEGECHRGTPLVSLPSQHLSKKNRLWRMGGRVFVGEAIGFRLFEV